MKNQHLTELAFRIDSSPAWITRALRGDAAARRVRHRIAAAITAKEAAKLGLTLEHEIERRKAGLRRNMEVTMMSQPQNPRRFVTRGMGCWVSKP
jgi:hypothetical protein